MFDWLFGLGAAQAAAAPAATAQALATAAPVAATGAAVDVALSAGATLAPDAAGPGGIAQMLMSFLPMLAIIVGFYFMMIRPQRNKDKKVKEMLNNLKVGDRICTIGGIYGTVKGLRDDTVELAVGGQDTPMIVARWAIRNVEAVSVENDGEVLA